MINFGFCFIINDRSDWSENKIRVSFYVWTSSNSFLRLCVAFFLRYRYLNRFQFSNLVPFAESQDVEPSKNWFLSAITLVDYDQMIFLYDPSDQQVPIVENNFSKLNFSAYRLSPSRRRSTAPKPNFQRCRPSKSLRLPPAQLYRRCRKSTNVISRCGSAKNATSPTRKRTRCAPLASSPEMVLRNQHLLNRRYSAPPAPPLDSVLTPDRPQLPPSTWLQVRQRRPLLGHSAFLRLLRQRLNSLSATCLSPAPMRRQLWIRLKAVLLPLKFSRSEICSRKKRKAVVRCSAPTIFCSETNPRRRPRALAVL